MLKLRLQYFGYLMWGVDSMEKTLMLGKIEGRKRRGRQRMRWQDGIIASMDMGSSKLQDIVKDREAWHAAVLAVAKRWTWPSYWTTMWNASIPDSSPGKESTCNAGHPGSIAGSGRSTGEGIGYPSQYSWASPVAQLIKNPPAMQATRFDYWVRKIHWRRERLPTPVFWPGEWTVVLLSDSFAVEMMIFCRFGNKWRWRPGQFYVRQRIY